MQKTPLTEQGANRSATELNGFAGWIFEQLRTYRRTRAPGRREMQLVETLSLGGKRQLMLVECGGERFLIGGGAESVETIVKVSTRRSSPGVDALEDFQ